MKHVVTRFTIKSAGNGMYEVDDQEGWGSDDFPEDVVKKLRLMARETGVEIVQDVEAATTQGPVAPEKGKTTKKRTRLPHVAEKKGVTNVTKQQQPACKDEHDGNEK